MVRAVLSLSAEMGEASLGPLANEKAKRFRTHRGITQEVATVLATTAFLSVFSVLSVV
jgi:hypothetical protein